MTSNTDIARDLGELSGTMKALVAAVDAQRVESKDGRQRIYGHMDEFRDRMGEVEHGLSAVTKTVEALSPVVGDMQKLGERAKGARWAGRILIVIGAALMGAFAWLFRVWDGFLAVLGRF